MKSDWRSTTLKDELELAYGTALTKQDRLNGSYPVFGSNGVIGYHSKYLVKGPGIIIGRKGSVGGVSYSEQDFWPIDTTFYVKLKEGNDIRFWYYLLKTLKLETMDSHSAVPGLSRDAAYNLQCFVPPLDEQQSLAGVLAALDSKIDLNDQLNIVLERTGRALFKHWFIDFEFPNEDGEPYKSSGGGMKDSELGLIPETWEAVRLADFISLDKGLSYKGKFLSQQGTPMINLGTISPDNRFIRTRLKHYSGEFRDKQQVRPGDVVIANTDITQKREVLGSPAIVPDDLDSENILFTHHIFAVRNNSTIPNLFIYYLLKLQSYRDRVQGFATGTTVLALPPDAVLDYLFAKPDNDTLNQFNVFAGLVHILSTNNDAESRNLTAIRDILLPKLMHFGVGVYYPTDSTGSTKHNRSETAEAQPLLLTSQNDSAQERQDTSSNDIQRNGQE
jgi:type I restriction enzyme S subunit